MPEITLRSYSPDDYSMISGWYREHGSFPLDKSMIPESTVIVCRDDDPVAVGSIFPCNNNHVAFFHGMATKPGQTITEAKEALTALQDGIDIMMAAGGHTLLFGTIRPGGMTRCAKMFGFDIVGEPVHTVARLSTPKLPHDHGT